MVLINALLLSITCLKPVTYLHYVILTQPLISDAQLAEINQAYSRHCISSCIDPYVTYFRCLSTASSTNSSLYISYAELFQNGICGQESGDYCLVLLARQNRTNSAIFDQTDACYSYNDGRVFCNSTTSARCLNGLTRTASLMGCCARPLIGSGIDSCPGVNADPSCNSPANKVYPLATLSFVAVILLTFFF